MKKLFVLALSVFLSGYCFSQDLIIKINREKIVCKVVEVGTQEVKYQKLDKPDDPVYGISKGLISEIKLADGTVIKFTPELTNAENYIGQKQHAIKYHFLSPLGNRLTFGYEQVIIPGINADGKIGIIGMGFSLLNKIYTTSGVFGKAGVKFLADKSFSSDNERYSNLLQGFYIKPELAYSTFRTKWEYNKYYATGKTETYEVNNNSAAFLINIGYQVLFVRSFTFDLFAGTGYAYSWNKNKSNVPLSDFNFTSPVYYSHTTFGNKFPLAFSSGISIGLAF